METQIVELSDGSKQGLLVIYTLSTLYIKKVKDKEKRIVLGEVCESGKTRCVGWYASLEKAKECVEMNWGCFDECGYYNYLVIEKVFEGPYGLGSPQPDVPTEWWYKYDYNSDGWISCNKPEIFKYTVGFWM